MNKFMVFFFAVLLIVGSASSMVGCGGGPMSDAPAPSPTDGDDVEDAGDGDTGD